jgi:hypothetical protein
LDQCQLGKELIPAMRSNLKITFNSMLDSSLGDSKLMIAKLSDLKEKLEKVEDRFAAGGIDRSIYEKTSAKIRVEDKQISEELEKTNVNISNPSDLIEKRCPICLRISEFLAEWRL